MLFCPVIDDLEAQAELVRQRAHGVIEVVEGRFVGLHLRRLPKMVSLLQQRVLGCWLHAHRPGDRCWLYYDQPAGSPNYLALKYVISYAGASFATARCAALMLDKIARIKHSDALVCDVANARISDRLLRRWGWEPHCESRWHRHFIKRFYGQYPAAAEIPRDDLAIAAS